jgi:glucarate dehydratase
VKITHIDYLKIYVPWNASLSEPMQRWRALSGTTPEEEDAYVIVQVHTDAGITGLGEGGRSLKEARAVGESYVGQDPLRMPWFDMQPPFLHAMVDIAGKTLGVPAHQILGGACRDTVSVAYWSPYLPPHETARHAEEGARLGFKVHKIKARPWDAVAQVEAMASAAGPDYRIRIDPNETFGLPAEAARIDRGIAAYNVECLEDPVPKARPEWWAWLRSRCAIPLALHSRDGRLIAQMARLDAIDYVNVGGAPRQAQAAGAVARAVGCPSWVQFEGHCLDIAAAFNVHLAATIPGATLPSDILHFLRAAYLALEPLVPHEGYVDVPQGDGLGVELDESLVERYRVA